MQTIIPAQEFWFRLSFFFFCCYLFCGALVACSESSINKINPNPHQKKKKKELHSLVTSVALGAREGHSCRRSNKMQLLTCEASVQRGGTVITRGLSSFADAGNPIERRYGRNKLRRQGIEIYKLRFRSLVFARRRFPTWKEKVKECVRKDIKNENMCQKRVAIK